VLRGVRGVGGGGEGGGGGVVVGAKQNSGILDTHGSQSDL